MVALVHEDMVERILSVYDRATPDQRVAGARWYPMAGKIVASIGVETGYGPDVIAHVLAALSPRNPWAWNVQDAYGFAVAARNGEPRPSATTFERNRSAAWAMLTSRTERIALWATDAPKVRNFVAAILGDRAAVVVDTWAYRVATGETPGKPGTGRRIGSFKPRLYEPIKAAYVEAAALRAVDPRDMQAVTWLVAQTEGLASERRGRHDLVLKRGTATFVAELLGGAL